MHQSTRSSTRSIHLAPTVDEDGEPTIEDVMTTAVAVVRMTDALAFAAQILLWRGIRHLPVLDAEDRLVGMLSERDLLRHVLEGPAGQRPVSEFMSAPVTTVTRDTKVSEVAALFAALHVDSLAVVDEGRLSGIVTTSDILAERGRSLRRTRPPAPRAADIMHDHVVAVHPEDTLESAIVRLLAADVRHVPVVDDELRVVGIVSDRDVRTAVGDPRRALDLDGGRDGSIADRFVRSVMTARPITVGPQASIGQVAEIFVDERIGAVPVVRDDDTLLGIISYVDVIGHFVGRRH